MEQLRRVETNEVSPETATTVAEEETVDVFYRAVRLCTPPAQASLERMLPPSRINPDPDNREALERSELLQTIGCRQEARMASVESSTVASAPPGAVLRVAHGKVCHSVPFPLDVA